MIKRVVRRLVTKRPEEDKAPVLEPRQFKNLLVKAKGETNGVRNLAIVWHSFGCGLRVTEIALLKVEDVLTRSGEIMAVAELPGSYTKNGKPRYFFQVDPALRNALDAYLNYRVEHGIFMSDNEASYRGLQPKSCLYIARGGCFSLATKTYRRDDGKKETYKVSSSLQQLLSRLVREAGVKGGRSHSGRRTLATRLDARGVDDGLIQAILGHGDKNQTMDYIAPNLTKIRAAMAGIYRDDTKKV
jgi:integrase/recombinase XerD